TYSWKKKRAPLAIGEWDRGTNSITIRERIVDESSASAAEIALRNTAGNMPRVLVPAGDGAHFYGYTIHFSFFEEGFVQREDHEILEDYWFHFPGTIFLQPGEFHPDFGEGGEAEHQQRSDILTRALAASGTSQ